MDSLSKQHSSLVEFRPEMGDLVTAALLAYDPALFNPFGIEPVASVPIPATSTALATVPAPTLLARLGKLPNWQRGLLAAGAGLVLVYGLVALVGVKAAVVGAAAV